MDDLLLLLLELAGRLWRRLNCVWCGCCWFLYFIDCVDDRDVVDVCCFSLLLMSCKDVGLNDFASVTVVSCCVWRCSWFNDNDVIDALDGDVGSKDVGLAGLEVVVLLLLLFWFGSISWQGPPALSAIFVIAVDVLALHSLNMFPMFFLFQCICLL